MKTLRKYDVITVIILLLLLPFIAVAQTTRLEYFRSSVSGGEVILTWSTFTEDGADVFTVLKSKDAGQWEVVTTVQAQEVKDGAKYQVKVGQLDGLWYYKLMWTDGFSYATTTTPTWAKPVQYNYLGQQTNQGWLIH